MNSIRLIRSRLGLSQQALADALDVSQGSISFYENGKTVPPDVAKRVIAFALARGMWLTFNDIYQEDATPHGNADSECSS